MKSPTDFENYFSNLLTPLLELLEVERKNVVTTFWSAITYSVLFIPALIPFFMFQNPWFLVILVLPFLLLIKRLTIYQKAKDQYVKNFKQQVISGMVKQVNEKLTYEPEFSISTGEYAGSQIFNQRIDRFKGGDLISGQLEKTSIRFSELWHEEKHVSTDSKGRRTESWVTIFKGIFFIADFNKDFTGKLFVLPDSGIDFLGIGKWMDKVIESRGQAIDLEDPVFEKYFKCYGSNQVESRYILSTSLMKRLTDFREKVKIKIYVSFIASKVFIAIPLSKDLFEPNVFSTGMKDDYLQEYFYYLTLVTGIVDDLNLNTRIWSKQ